MTLERISSQILSLSNDAQSILQLKDCLKAEEKEILKHRQQIPEALQKLNPLKHSLGYLYLL